LDRSIENGQQVGSEHKIKVGLQLALERIIEVGSCEHPVEN
jgi:hypothetical protein